MPTVRGRSVHTRESLDGWAGWMTARCSTMRDAYSYTSADVASVGK